MLPQKVQHYLHDCAKKHLLRKRRLGGAADHSINFCSNDYLNLATHHDVKKALIESANIYGLGSGSSPIVAGYSKPHQALEEAFAEFLKRDRAIIFNSGYHANLGVLTALAHRNSTIIADKFCHASLIDGALLSRAKLHRYEHQQLAQAAALLAKTAQDDRLLISESVFSMQGNITDAKQLAHLCQQFSAMLIIDDAHGIGVLGAEGGGICEHFNLSQTDIPCLITPLGKALGSFGAIVSGKEAVMEAILQLARAYRYSTALPPAVCSGTLAALQVLRRETWRREKLRALSRFFVQEALKRELDLVAEDETPIKSILIGSNEIAVLIQETLADEGLIISSIRPPTVPVHTARIRVSLNCMHAEQQITLLLDRIKDVYDQSKKRLECQ